MAYLKERKINQNIEPSYYVRKFIVNFRQKDNIHISTDAGLSCLTDIC